MKTCLIFLSLFASVHCLASPDWKLKKQNDRLKVYTASVENSTYKAVRVECTVNGTFSQIISVLFDTEKQKDWVFNTKYSKLLKKQGNELIYYSEVTVPWPCTNRDFIAHLSITQPAPDLVKIVSHAEPTIVPEKKGIVRIKSSKAEWTMKALSNNQVKIDYVVQFDPAGSVPSWLTNMFVIKGPYETFEKLQGRINMPEYKNAHFDFVKE
jgi:hypothetical protein